MNREFVVVTGANGFVGQALCRHFTDTGRRYRAVIRAAVPGGATHADVVALGDLAIADDSRLAAVLEGATAVVHLAGRAHVLREGSDELALHRAANVVATGRLAAAAVFAGVRRFVFASTIKVHGESTLPGRPFRRDDAFAPQDAYALAKAEAEHALVTVCAGTSMAPVILRTPLVYGPGVRGNFLVLIDAVARRALLPLAAIDNRRDLLYVGNLVHAIAATLDCAERRDGAWLIADGEPIATPELVRRIAAELGVAPRLLRVPVPLLEIAARFAGRELQVRRLVQSLEVDATPFSRSMGALPHRRDSGLASTIRWWRARHAL